MQVVLSAINSKYIHTGLGLRYVGEYAKTQGHEVTLIEETINTPILAVLEKIMAVPAQVYGFSVHIWNKPFVFKLIRMLRKLRPQAAIVIGGPEVAFDAERIFAELPQADYIVQGEGELVFSELLQYLAGGGAVSQHIAYREGEQVNLNGGITVIEDMSLLPFPYPDLEKMLAEHKIVYYECTRGCPFNCAYCLSSISRSVRKRPLELVLRDLDRFIAAGVPLVKFVDRTYNLDEKYFLPMMQHLAQADTNATFHFEIKADILSERVMDFLATVPKGRFQLEVGIQSTHQPTLKAINRQDNWEKLAANVKRLLSFGNMHIHVDLIAGLPYITNVNEIDAALNSLLGEIDALYIPTDNTIANAAALVNKKAIEKKIPVIAAERGMVENGALATLGIDYKQLGRNTADVVIKIIEGEKPENIAVTTLTDMNLIVNTDTVEALGITLPKDIDSKAEKIQGSN